MQPQTTNSDVLVRTRPPETSSNVRFASDLNGEGRPRPATRHGAVADAEARIATLTAREREVCGLVTEELTHKQVGHHLCVSPITVRHHLSSIFRRLLLQSRFALIVMSYQHQLAGHSADSRPARPDGR